jgi:hypothetical protein
VSSPKTAPTMVSVFDGQQCLGHVIARGNLYEAFDRDDRSLGIFKTQSEAARALPDRGKP